jgi:proline dehydrogenase
MTEAPPVERLVTGTRAGLALARRFVAGNTLEEAVVVARRLNQAGHLVSLDLLGEEVHDDDSAHRAADEYLECLDRISEEGLGANISVKPTQLGLAIDEGVAADTIERLATRALEVGTTVTIDMEDSRYTQGTIRLFEKTQPAVGNLGIALQAYLHRTPGDIDRLAPLGGHIRLCKGAYVESEDVALTSKRDVDVAYAEQLRTLMGMEETTPAVATHDAALIDLAKSLATERDSSFEFQMLYGVRPDLQRFLVSEGYPLRIYLPFGSQWYPYLTRRLAERPANVWFLLKTLLGR